MPNKEEGHRTEREIDKIASIWLTFITVGLFVTIAIWATIDLTPLDISMPLPNGAIIGFLIASPIAFLSAFSRTMRKLVEWFWVAVSEVLYFGS